MDFYELQLIKGFPPKVIWLRFGNTTTDELVLFFEKQHLILNEFITSSAYQEIGCLEFNSLN